MSDRRAQLVNPNRIHHPWKSRRRRRRRLLHDIIIGALLLHLPDDMLMMLMVMIRRRKLRLGYLYTVLQVHHDVRCDEK